MEEIWKEIPGFEGYYEVSNQGRVRSLDRKVGNRLCKGRILKFNVSKKGYYQLQFKVNSNYFNFRAHQLVAMAFLNHKPDGTMKVCVDHINNIKTDNRLENLQLISNRENSSKDRKGYSSKYTGVNWHKRDNKWESKIKVDGVHIFLGRFDTEEEASKYYQDALKAIEEGAEIKVKKHKVSSRYKGVCWHKRDSKWMSYIYIDGKRKHLGYFNCETSAYLAYQAELSKISVKN